MILLLASLFPLGLYCLMLASLNRRPHPRMVGGAWDFAGVLFGVSGLLLVAGPAIVSGLSERWRMFWLLGQRAGLHGADLFHPLGLLYFLVVVGGAAWMLRSRRRFTAIYNVEAPLFDVVLAEALNQTGLKWARHGQNVFLTPSPGGFEPLPDGTSFLVVRVETFAALRHVALRWDPTESTERQQVEERLRQALEQVPAEEGPVAAWFLLAASAIFGVLILALAVALLLLFWARN